MTQQRVCNCLFVCLFSQPSSKVSHSASKYLQRLQTSHQSCKAWGQVEALHLVQHCTWFKICDEPPMANKGAVGCSVRTSHGIPGHARHRRNAKHHWSYFSVLQSLCPSFRSCKGEYPPPLPLLTPLHQQLPCRD